MKQVFILLAVISMGCSGNEKSKSQGEDQVEVGLQKLTVADWKKEMASQPTPIVLDVRTKEEVSYGHIPKAQHIDFFSSSLEAELKTLDSTQPIFIYCKVGGRSQKAGEKLMELGFEKVYNLDGGYDAWVSSKQAVVKTLY